MEGTQARGARSAAAAIKVATVTLVSFGAAAAASLAAYEGTEWDRLNRHAQRAALSRHSLGSPLILDVCLKSCPQAQCIVRARASGGSWVANLF